MRGILIYTWSTPKCRFILKLQIICLWTEKVIPTSSPPPSPPTFTSCDRVDFNPFWLLTHVTVHFILLAVHRVLTKMTFSLHHSCYNRFPPPPLSSCGLWCHSGIFLQALSLSVRLSFSVKIPLCCFIRPQIASQYTKDKRLAN